MAGTRIAFAFALLGLQAVTSQGAPGELLPWNKDKAAFQQAEEKRQNVLRMLSTKDVISLSQNGLSDDVIIWAIHRRGLAFYPPPQVLDELKEAGVSPGVIREIEHYWEDAYDWPDVSIFK